MSADTECVNSATYLEAPDNVQESGRVEIIGDEVPVDHVDTESEMDSIEQPEPHNIRKYEVLELYKRTKASRRKACSIAGQKDTSESK